MTYKEIYNNLQNGGYYTEELNGFEYSVLIKSGNYIRWRYFGSSANKNTLKDLIWIIETIFECDANTFTEKFKLQWY